MLAVGCNDCCFRFYILIDVDIDNIKDFMPNIASWQLEFTAKSVSSVIRSWDKVANCIGAMYSSPPPAIPVGPSDKEGDKGI